MHPTRNRGGGQIINNLNYWDMKTKSIKQVFEQLERIKEFARSRNKFIELIDKAYDYTDNMEVFHDVKCYGHKYDNEAKDLVPVYWCDEAFKPVPFEIYTKH